MLLLLVLACSEPADISGLEGAGGGGGHPLRNASPDLSAGASSASDPAGVQPCGGGGEAPVTVRTSDGATIALHRHANPGAPPVILVHGISSNGRFWDLDAESSLAAWLAARGSDVWVLDLRGHGAALAATPEDARTFTWDADDYGLRDAPAALRHVQAATGYRTVGWVGHSMGGMVGAIHLANGGEADLSSFIAVASPAGFSKDDPLVGVAQRLMEAGGVLPSIDTPGGARLAAAMGARDLTGILGRLYNPANIPPARAVPMLESIASPISRAELRHFARMIADERIESRDGSTVWTDALRGVTVPTLAFTGGADHIVPAARAEGWKDVLGGPVEVVHLDTAHGAVADYGHLDFGIGVRAPTEVWPHIAAFLTAHPGQR
jgi:pimeloyl-ACP methyl ester carboxylesterase